MNGIKVIVSFVCGFVVAQIIKFIIGYFCGDKKKIVAGFGSAVEYLLKSGGMPSGHAASLTAATVSIGLLEGFGTSIFALALCVLVIVIYDAVNVRYIVGEQGKALNKLIKKPLRIVEGHVITEVLVGILIGVLVGCGVFLAF